MPFCTSGVRALICAGVSLEGTLFLRGKDQMCFFFHRS